MLGRIETGRLLCSVPSLNYHRGQYIAPCVPAFDLMPRLKRHGKAVFSGSDASSARVDQEVRDILKQCDEKAIQLLEQDVDAMDRIAQYLLEKENISGEEFMALLNEK